LALKLFKHWTAKLLSPGTFLRDNYASFKKLLEYDKRCHELIAELEDIYYNEKKVDLKQVERRYAELSAAVFSMMSSLTHMSPAAYDNLWAYFQKIDAYVHYIFTPLKRQTGALFTIPLNAIDIDDRPMTGDKAFNLAMLSNNLDLRIPAGFVITTHAFHTFIDHNNLQTIIDEGLTRLDISSSESLQRFSTEITTLVADAVIPPVMAESIISSFAGLQKDKGGGVQVAMRSSATLEDSETSFAGQYQTELHVDRDSLLSAYKRIVASKYSPRALYYRINHGISDMDTPMAVLVLVMVDAVASGVVYTADPAQVSVRTMAVHSLWGLGELLVGGEVSPDSVYLSKEPRPHIIERRLGDKFKEMTAGRQGGVQIEDVDEKRRHSPALADAEVLELARIGLEVEELYGEPQDIEWCQDQDKSLYILQARPLRCEAEQPSHDLAVETEIAGPLIFQGGECASSGLASGRLFFLENYLQLNDVPAGSILVTQSTLPGYVKVIDRLEAIITERGSVAGHFASVAREFGLPAIVNAGPAIRQLQHGMDVTVCAHKKNIHQGLISLPPRQVPARTSKTPFMRKFKYILNFVSPLTLIDTTASSFSPEGCRSLHDIIRFCHEKGMQEMFATGAQWGTRINGAKKVISKIPMTIYVLDVGKGLADAARNMETISLAEIHCLAMHAVWAGLSHPDIDWSQQSHFDWQSFDNVALAGGIARENADAFASYAIISHDYLNLNLRFGYHFTVLDTLCGPDDNNNYIILRFAGGGGDFTGRTLRVIFLSRALINLGFHVESKGDLIDARLSHQGQDLIKDTLNMVGRLLGVTRLLDMSLKNEDMVEEYLADFFAEKYDFAPQKKMT
jgi:pyruvate,water dikinase